MVSYFLKALGRGGASPKDQKSEDEKSAVRALPAPWYQSEKMYELERRAIFSKKWLLTTHKSRIPKSGDWLRCDVAGFPFMICRDRQGNVNAFHNHCRHRGYPIVNSDAGHASIFKCQYHGWTYGIDGKLTKAREFTGQLEEFDKSKNGLLPIHVHIDKRGFVWVNLDSGEKPEIAWEDDFGIIDKQERLNDYNFDDYRYDHSWHMEGDWNWKILADNYNECYHCETSHPDIPKIADLTTYSVETESGNVQHFPNPKREMIEAGLKVAANFCFPNASMNVSPHIFFIQRFVPCGPHKSIMRYEVYRNKNSSDEEFGYINEIYKRIMTEDKGLCNGVQGNLNADVFVNGEMHPRWEKGPIHFQKTVRELVMAHFNLEQKAGRKIEPAKQKLPNTASVSEKDIDFCARVDSCTMSEEGGDLEW